MNTFLLDLDETLLDFPKAERANFTYTMRQIRCGKDLYPRFHQINEELWLEFEQGKITREELKIKRFQRLFAEEGLVADAHYVARFYSSNFCRICYPYEGAKECLQRLSERGRCYVVTNGGGDIQRAHMASAGFVPYLSGVFISEEIGVCKPTEAFARYVEAHIPAYDRTQTVWIGNSRTSDMVCAKTVGIPFILFSMGKKPENFDGAYATGYEELLALLGRM